MTSKLTALIEAAKTSLNATHPDEVAWYASDTLVNKGVAYVEDSNFIALADPTTIIELCALLEKVGAALQSWANTINYQYTGSREAMTHLQECDGQGQEALAAIKQWKEQT